MSFGVAITSVLRQYADFDGYAQRSEFWWWMLFDGLMTGLLRAIDPVTVAGDASAEIYLAGLWGIVALLPTLAVTVRRVRDAGYRPAVLLWLIVPVFGIVAFVILACQESAPRPVVPADLHTVEV